MQSLPCPPPLPPSHVLTTPERGVQSPAPPSRLASSGTVGLVTVRGPRHPEHLYCPLINTCAYKAYPVERPLLFGHACGAHVVPRVIVGLGPHQSRHMFVCSGAPSDASVLSQGRLSCAHGIRLPDLSTHTLSPCRQRQRTGAVAAELGPARQTGDSSYSSPCAVMKSAA